MSLRTSLTRTATVINGRFVIRSCSPLVEQSCRFIHHSRVDTLKRTLPAAGKQIRFSSSSSTPTPLKNMWTLAGKVTVVTGGARGIGLALATVSAECGSDIAIVDTLEEPHPDFDKLSRFGVKAKYYKSDVTKPDILTKTFDDIAADYGHIDNCITAAGICMDKSYLEHKWEESQRILNVNVMGTYFSAQLAAKHMSSQGTGGSVIMVASVSSHCAIPSQRISMYAASKGAVRIMARHIAVELAPHNIRVNTISPGYIATDLTAKLLADQPDLMAIFESAAPIQRMGQRDDLKGIVAYLLSDASTYTTGTDISIDGGLSAGRI